MGINKPEIRAWKVAGLQHRARLGFPLAGCLKEVGYLLASFFRVIHRDVGRLLATFSDILAFVDSCMVGQAEGGLGPICGLEH
jgi:hypothetical protein